MSRKPSSAFTSERSNRNRLDYTVISMGPKGADRPTSSQRPAEKGLIGKDPVGSLLKNRTISGQVILGLQFPILILAGGPRPTAKHYLADNWPSANWRLDSR